VAEFAGGGAVQGAWGENKRGCRKVLLPNGPGGAVSGANAAEHETIFKWETMKEVGRHELQYRDGAVPGEVFEVELTSGRMVRVWRADNGHAYFCHGLTFGGKEAPGGVISPLGDHVSTILRGHYEVIAEAQARAGDILVWHGFGPNDVVHSVILSNAVVTPGTNNLDYAARLQTKNGLLPETNMTLGQLIENFYGESYNAYRKRTS
jgi:hypothetical protein